MQALNERQTVRNNTVFKKYIALPQDHGAWVFLFSPLLIGLWVSRTFTLASFVLALAALVAFLLRQPLSIVVKVWSGRRARTDLPSALFWTALYSGILFVLVLWLVMLGHARLVWLGVPAVPIFAWHLWLIHRHQERRQAGLEIVATGVLALGAPAAFWVGRNAYDPQGWVLWLLCWLQSAASIVYVYLRLAQREWSAPPSRWIERLRPAWRALLYATFNVGLTLALGFGGLIPRWVWLAFAWQWAETLYGTLRPAVKMRPTTIGVRQLIVSTVFTVLFLVLWQ